LLKGRDAAYLPRGAVYKWEELRLKLSFTLVDGGILTALRSSVNPKLRETATAVARASAWKVF